MDRHGAAAPPRPAKPPGRAARVPPRALVSLAQPRPDSERRLNAYVEAPPRAAPRAPASPAPAPTPRAGGRGRAPALAPAAPKRPVTEQPAGKRTRAECPRDSIICESCGRCRCAQCARPRPLPSRWLGDCLCSAETAIDYASCMCCAKALFYHCCDDGDGSACADEPCSCAGSRRGARWGCLAALAVALPCLACYWPLRGAAALCADCYARAGSSGCRCRERAPDKLPLAPPPPRP